MAAHPAPTWLPPGNSIAAFLCNTWQQEPLFVRQAFPGVEALVDGNDLAGIACEPEGDARFVACDNSDWRAEHGPFDDAFFAQLPAHGWTLLVQAVDQWIPGVGELLSQFGFLPRWRLDDIMVSYATDGGGVGPHFDYYDVFLIQAAGEREWKIGQRCDARSPLRDNPFMKLLRDFDPTATHVVASGDLLYLPAGIAHWGTAVGDDCITISVGFRAPSCAELLDIAAPEHDNTAPEHLRYRDTPAAIDADPWRINEAAADNLVALCQPYAPAITREALIRALGQLATEPRYPQYIAAETELSPTRLQQQLDKGLQPAHHPGSRFAYHALAGQATLFADGHSHACNTALAQGICHGRVDAGMIHTQEELALLLALINQGSLLP